MEPILSIHNLNLIFGKDAHRAVSLIEQGLERSEIHTKTQNVVAIHDISLNIYRGEILVLMGLSGSGKSSFLRCLNGMQRRKEKTAQCGGSVYFHKLSDNSKVSLLDCSKSTLRNIRRSYMSMVFQDFALMPWRTAIENVAYPLEIQGMNNAERRHKAIEKLNLVGLSNWGDYYPHELSGGMQQRVGLARALVTDADILFMDEPFSALDPLHRKHLQDEMLTLHAELKKTIVFVTHDIREAMRIGDRLAIMDEGKILQIGTPAEIMQTPHSKKVKEFTADFTGIDL